VVAVGGVRNERLGAQTQEIVLAHQPENALGVDDVAFAPQLRGDPAIAIVTMSKTDALYLITRVSVCATWLVDHQTTIVAGARNSAQPAQPPDVGVLVGLALRLRRAHLSDDRVELVAMPFRGVASMSRKASRKKSRSTC
jgi:hypothetical protein